MNCLEFEENLPLFLYEELSAEERAACEAHLV
ncbi:MAG: zf-HC2 domain-containing protein [Acidobacteriia bacterium]|nr:zf-HC2 domain-containing protein [Terriglobia bacterium]